MTVRVGINGFGRVGRSFTRAVLARGKERQVDLVAVNDPFGDADTMAFLLKHDSIGGTLANELKVESNAFSIDGKSIEKLEARDPRRSRGVIMASTSWSNRPVCSRRATRPART